MSDKALVIISSGDVDKALTGLMWATNALRFGWMEDVRVIFFGPAQKLLLEDERVAKFAAQIREAEAPVACKYISDKEGNSEQIEAKGVRVDYVGPIIANLIKDGYAPMVY